MKAKFVNKEGGIIIFDGNPENDLYVDSGETYELALKGAFGIVEPFIEPVLSQDEIIANLELEIRAMVELYLADLVRSQGYLSRDGYAKYVGYDNELRAKSEKLGAYESGIWIYCGVELEKLKSGARDLITPIDFIKELPDFI